MAKLPPLHPRYQQTLKNHPAHQITRLAAEDGFYWNRAMSQAIIDPEEVRRFAAELKRFNGDLRERSNSLLSRFNALGDTWKDQEQEKFAVEFLQMMKSVKSFLEASEKHTPHL